MNASWTRTIAIGGVCAAALAAGCNAPVDTTTSEIDEPIATAAPKAPALSLRLEQAERSLDLGRDVAGARAALEAILRDPAITPEQRDQARFALSRAHEAAGDREAAIAAIEALLADHPDGARYPLEQTAEARLRKLLTGSEGEPKKWMPDGRQAPPFARVLAKYFPVPRDTKQGVTVRVAAFGGDNETSDRLGTFAVGRAIRELRREACALCDERLPIHLAATRIGSWTGIPRTRAQLGSALVIHYFDLGEGRTPARYDAELPLPSAEIVAHLERGEGLVAARERPGAPPVILIAAPREAQLADVEEALAEMKELPLEPKVVEIKPTLKANEIQGVMRASFDKFRGCYEAVLRRAPDAKGKATLRFTIRPDGVVEKATVETSEGALHDATFEGCMGTAVGAITFPSTRAKDPTTVTYPISFAPGD
jgi:hypothetical protein